MKPFVAPEDMHTSFYLVCTRSRIRLFGVASESELSDVRLWADWDSTYSMGGEL